MSSEEGGQVLEDVVETAGEDDSGRVSATEEVTLEDKIEGMSVLFRVAEPILALSKEDWELIVGLQCRKYLTGLTHV